MTKSRPGLTCRESDIQSERLVDYRRPNLTRHSCDNSSVVVFSLLTHNVPDVSAVKRRRPLETVVSRSINFD
jgi:hypothetical protein